MQISVATVVGSSHIQHIENRLHSIRTSSHQVELARHLRGFFQSVNRPHEKWDGDLRNFAGVFFIQVGVNISGTRYAPRPDLDPFPPGRIIFVSNKGMWVVVPDYDRHGYRNVSVIHINSIVRGARLSPIFDTSKLPSSLDYTHSLDYFSVSI